MTYHRLQQGGRIAKVKMMLYGTRDDLLSRMREEIDSDIDVPRERDWKPMYVKLVSRRQR